MKVSEMQRQQTERSEEISLFISASLDNINWLQCVRPPRSLSNRTTVLDNNNGTNQLLVGILRLYLNANAQGE